MAHALPEKYRPASQLKVGDEIQLVHGPWARIESVESTDAAVMFRLDDGQCFYALRSQTLYSRRR